MHTLRFLVSRRWIAFALVVVFLAWVAWRLGEWQFHRLDDRKERNAIVERNEKAGPADAEAVLSPGADPPASLEWRVVEATGTYAVEDTVIVRYRTRDGEAIWIEKQALPADEMREAARAIADFARVEMIVVRHD